jgi:hypothetical protein
MHAGLLHQLCSLNHSKADSGIPLDSTSSEFALVYVESLVEWQGQWNGTLHLLRRDDLAIHHQCSGSGTANPAQIVEGKRGEAEPVIFEVEYDGALAGREPLGGPA